ncbi:MAG: aminomethyl-transferring glycine dehydrogenase subunit GcvPB, partial [Vallitaleaceae bacterium]|nr:aminomethyl-transferring glycine dehydrogenase subunit GcvPB [Vallitaleaceae bacterium]
MMNLIFEESVSGRGCTLLPPCDVPLTTMPENLQRQRALRLPEIAETDLIRHYTSLSQRVHGVNNGFYPLGSCTMKYNPRINEEIAGLPGFAKIHPLQPEHTLQGCLQVLHLAETYLCE